VRERGTRCERGRRRSDPLRAIGVSVQDEQDGPVDTEGRSVVVAVEDREADHVAVERGRLVEVCDPGAARPIRVPAGSRSSDGAGASKSM